MKHSELYITNLFDLTNNSAYYKPRGFATFAKLYKEYLCRGVKAYVEVFSPINVDIYAGFLSDGVLLDDPTLRKDYAESRSFKHTFANPYHNGKLTVSTSLRKLEDIRGQIDDDYWSKCDAAPAKKPYFTIAVGTMNEYSTSSDPVCVRIRFVFYVSFRHPITPVEE